MTEPFGHNDVIANRVGLGSLNSSSWERYATAGDCPWAGH